MEPFNLFLTQNFGQGQLCNCYEAPIWLYKCCANTYCLIQSLSITVLDIRKSLSTSESERPRSINPGLILRKSAPTLSVYPGGYGAKDLLEFNEDNSY